MMTIAGRGKNSGRGVAACSSAGFCCESVGLRVGVVSQRGFNRYSNVSVQPDQVPRIALVGRMVITACPIPVGYTSWARPRAETPNESAPASVPDHVFCL